MIFTAKDFENKTPEQAAEMANEGIYNAYNVALLAVERERDYDLRAPDRLSNPLHELISYFRVLKSYHNRKLQPEEKV